VELVEQSNKNTMKIYSPEVLEKMRASSDLKSKKSEESRKKGRGEIEFRLLRILNDKLKVMYCIVL
jgi:hypothetical protein